MNTILKISLLTFCILCSFNLKAQRNIQWGNTIKGVQQTGVYKTLDDLKNNKLEDIGKIENVNPGWFMVGKKFFMYGKVDFIGFRDEYENRYRIINGKAYNVLSYGKLYLYSQGYVLNSRDQEGNTDRSALGYDSFTMFYSQSEGGAPIKLTGWDKMHNEKIATLLFSDNEAVKAAYINDESDDYEPALKKVYADNLERMIHYADVYNGLAK